MSVDRNASHITDFTDHAFLCDEDILPSDFSTAARTAVTTPTTRIETNAAEEPNAEQNTRQLHLQSVEEVSWPNTRSATSPWAIESDASTSTDMQTTCGSNFSWRQQDRVSVNVADATAPHTEEDRPTVCDGAELLADINQEGKTPVNAVKLFKSMLL
jgi:hypothetical protein